MGNIFNPRFNKSIVIQSPYHKGRGEESRIGNSISLIHIPVAKTLRPEFAFLSKTRRSFCG